jgi:hypothetical protein
LLAAAAVAPAQQGPLDVIPADAAAALAVRNLDDLKTRGDKLLDAAKLNMPLRLSQLIPMGLNALGINAGVDYAGSFALIAAAPEKGQQQPWKNNPDKLLVLAVPFDDLGKMAGNFGLKPDQLGPGKVARRANGPPQVPILTEFFAVRGKHFLMGSDEKAVARVAGAKALRGELSGSQRKGLEEADVLLHFNPKAFAEPWQEMIKELERTLPKGLAGDEAKTARDLLAALTDVRRAYATLQLGAGVGVHLGAVFPEKGNEPARKLLAALGTGAAPASLRGLPEGPVLAAQAGSGDGERSAAVARVAFEFLLRDFLETRHILPAANRPVYAGVLEEVWQRLKGHRVAVYQTADEQELGLFSVAAILDTEDAGKFLADMRLLARIADESDAEPDKAKRPAVDPDKLIRALGDARYRVRESATLKLRLLGEPALPHLKTAMASKDAEVSRRAGQLWTQIGRAAAERRKELLQKDLPRHLRPRLTFVPKAETLAGQRVDVVRIRLADQDVPAAAQLRGLLGPEWDRMRLAVRGKQVVVLLGSDVGLLKKTLENLEQDRPGLAGAKSLADFNRQAGPGRKSEFHVSAERIIALMTPPAADAPPARPGGGLTSFALDVQADSLRLDVWLPVEELRVLVKQGWFR